MKKIKKAIKFIVEMVWEIEHIQDIRYEWKEQVLR